MANEVFLNPKFGVENILPTLDDESFLFFLETYYDWLQTTRIDYTNASGTFVKNEQIIGQNSRAKAVIRQVGDNYLIVSIQTKTPFDVLENIVGQNSNALAQVLQLKNNIIRNAAKIIDNKNPYYSMDEYFEFVKNELNDGLPSDTEANRRAIVNKFKNFYKSKSTEEAYKFLFNAVYNETVELRYPGEDILRVSDGKFEKRQILRVQFKDDIFELINQTIVGSVSGAVGNVIDIKTTFLGSIFYAELTLNLVFGVFSAGENIRVVGQVDGANTNTFGLVSKIEIVDGGSGYEVGDVVTITGDGSEAEAVVSSISSGPINQIIVNNVGHGYRVGTVANINNSGTGGSNLLIEVTEVSNSYEVTSGNTTYVVGETKSIQILNRGSNYSAKPVITLIDSDIQSLGLLSEQLITITNSGNDYSVGDVLTFTGGSGNNAAGEVASVGNTTPYGEENVLYEDNFILVQEQQVNGIRSAIKSEDWANLGSILRIELTNFGNNYTSSDLPTLTIEAANTVSGANATFTVDNIQGVSANLEVDIANNDIGIGSIRQIEITNPGINYTTANASVSSVGDGNAILVPEVSGLFVDNGTFTNDDGKVNIKIIQDSLFYQDFSYVIRSGLNINSYKELVKNNIHPAGLEFFGEILIFSYVLVSPNFLSEIKPEKTPPIELAIKSILSLYELNFNQEREIEIDIVPETIESTIETIREIEIDVVPETIDVITNIFNTGPINRFLELYIDATMAFYSEIVTLETDTKSVTINITLETQTTIETIREIEIDVVPETIDVITNIFNTGPINRFIEPYVNLAIDEPKRELTLFLSLNEPYEKTPTFSIDDEQVFIHSNKTFNDVFYAWGTAQFNKRTYEIDIVPETIQVISQFDIQEVNHFLELYIDATMEFYSDIVVLETGTKSVVITLTLETQTTTDTKQEIEIDIVPQTIDMSDSIYRQIELEINEKIYNVPIEKTSIGVKVQSITNTALNEITENVSFGDLQLFSFADESISSYSSFSFDDTWVSSVSVKKNIEASGTVSTIGTFFVGTNTDFVTEFAENRSIIINNEKFIVKNVANSSYLEVNVNPSTNYTNSTVYREFYA